MSIVKLVVQNDYWLSTSAITLIGAKVEVTTVEEWTKTEKESILQESTKATTKAGKFAVMKTLPNTYLSLLKIKFGKHMYILTGFRGFRVKLLVWWCLLCCIEHGLFQLSLSSLISWSSPLSLSFMWCLPLLTYILSLIPFIVVVSRRWPSSTSAPLAVPFSTIAIAIFITNIVILIIAIILFYRSFCSSRISWKVKTILYCEVVSYELGYSYLVD